MIQKLKEYISSSFLSNFMKKLSEIDQKSILNMKEIEKIKKNINQLNDDVNKLKSGKDRLFGNLRGSHLTDKNNFNFNVL